MSAEEIGRFALEMILKEFDETIKSSKRGTPFIIGIGSGSTIVPFFNQLVDHIEQMVESPNIVFIPTSEQAKFLILDRKNVTNAYRLGTLDEFESIDVTIDGADAVYFNEKVLIKGGGAAHLQEKVVAEASHRYVILVADEKKINKPIEGVAVPVEVIPFVSGAVKRSLQAIMKDKLVSCSIRSCQLGSGKIGPIVTDNGNLILDLKLRIDLADLGKTDELIHMCAGALCTGIFWQLPKMVTIVYPESNQVNSFKMY